MVAFGSLDAHGQHVQPRLNVRWEHAMAPGSTAHLLARDTKATSDNSDQTAQTVGITLGVSLPVIAIAVLGYLYWKKGKRQKMEEAHDPHADLDFGLGDGPMPVSKNKKKNRKSMLMGGEKASHKINQLSMDMNLDSPYLLPPKVHGSHDSVHSLTRSYPPEYDPYRMVNSECGSIRSFNRDTINGGSSKRASVATGKSITATTRQGSFPKTPTSTSNGMSPNEKSDPFATPPAMPEPTYQGQGATGSQEPMRPIRPAVPQIDSVPYPEDDFNDGPSMPDERGQLHAAATNPHNPLGVAQSDKMESIGVAHAGGHHPPQSQQGPAGLGLNLDLPQPASPDELTFQSPAQPQPGQAVTDLDNRRSQESDYGYQAYQPYHPEIQMSEHVDDGADVARGRSQGRGSQEQQGLGVPQQDNKRLSIGMRPLPPDDVTESEDPEYRANRIRSFYKEYFDDSKEAPPPMPNVPADYYGAGGYYEDYDQQYLGEAAYFDPDTNAFIMPYAEPVQRRAMTPPPAGRRGPPGPRPRGPTGARGSPGPHGLHGSMSGMSLPGGGRRPRAGSARAPSSLGPRPDSSASARYGRPQAKKNLPPPSALSTLPTPAKLKDDSFAIFNAADFAPPESFGDRAAGRSQSPLGERRPYSPKVPSASPLVTTFDELNVLPSPHTLRKSATFTNLDFLPPKKFKDGDTMSDAGSIRSNRSAISSTAQSAVRMGAGRVSRLPGDTVFTQQSMANELKPQWGMRP